MDAANRRYAENLEAHHYSPDTTPWRRMGQYLYRILEDGTHTQNRLGIIESLIPPKSNGPIFHYHEMHDEGFIITKGRVSFHSPGRPDIHAKAGDMVMIPLRLPHRFSNPFEEEACFLNTTSPAHYVRYFQYLEELVGEGMELTPEVNAKAMLKYGTVPLHGPDVELLEREAEEKRQREGKSNGTSGSVTESKKVNGETNGFANGHTNGSGLEGRLQEIKAELARKT